MVGIDGCGKSSTYSGVLGLLAENVRVVGIGDEVLGGGPNEPLRVRDDIPLTRSARLIGGFAKGLRSRRLYKNLKFVELAERSHIQRYVTENERPAVILGDGQPLVNSAAWCAAHFFASELESDARLLAACRYLAGDARIPLRELPFYLGRAWQLVLVNWVGLSRFQPPDLVYLLDLDPEIAMERIRERGKPLQVHETEAFLAGLRESYARVLDLLGRAYEVRVVTLRSDRLALEEVVAFVGEHVTVELAERGDLPASRPVGPDDTSPANRVCEKHGR